MERLGRRAVCLLALLLLVGCSGEERDQSRVRPGRVDTDPGVVHVHGLGVNPKDGALFAATHTGLFRLPDSGKAERIADRWQDTMGFTVVGPDHFLGSGHPDMADYRAGRLPSLLGLIESRDAGRTWQPLSLLGQADFHALRAVHGRAYGYDSTGSAFMVSSDGTTWEMRSKLAMLDFVVSPADPNLIVATTPAGVQRSRDGGRSWEALSAPALTFLSWQPDTAIWAVTERGVLFVSVDAGGGWQQVGAIQGKPNAFLAAGERLYVSVHEGGIFVSVDGGKTWRLRYRDPA